MDERAELVRVRKARQRDLNEAVLEGRSDAPGRSAFQLDVQRRLKED
jgi:hypothetical protein